MLVSLVTIASGPVFKRYAYEFELSAYAYFHPSEERDIRVLPGYPGWPQASMTRYRSILEAADVIEGDYIFLSDADNIFEGYVGPEILADGITVTTHPGFPDPGQPDAPWERDVFSCAYVAPSETEGRLYHPGAFVGGPREEFLAMATEIEADIQEDEDNGVVARWHDESHLNRYLLDFPPALVLDKRYCWWQHWGKGDGLIVHRDKTEAEFAERGAYGEYAA